MPEEMTDERREALRAFCDTIVPSIERADDPDGFWARSATDVGTDAALVEYLAAMPDEQREGLLGLLDALAAQGIAQASPRLARAAADDDGTAGPAGDGRASARC